MSQTYNAENPPQVTRNGVTLPLSEETFGKASPNKGQKFFALEATAVNIEDVRTFIGLDIETSVISRFLRRVGIDIFTDEKNKKQDGSLDWDAILTDWTEFDTGGATLKELKEQIDELQDEALGIMEDEKYVLKDDGVTPEYPDEYVQLTERIKSINNKIRPLKKQMKAITDKYAAIAARRAANKEAAPATA